MKRTTGFSNEDKPKFMRGFTRKGRQRHGRYSESDPSILKRVIKDGYDGQEFIVIGDKQETFAQACRAHWQFKSVNLKSKWYITDEKGNDVTDRYLETAEGVFVLTPEYRSEIQKEEPDEYDEYSSIHDSVTYYD
ncbi:hypothetical protein EU528_10490 [Candidatus Thorarchaeota archaeon]|nr:MAG: hypothetical protein EU528_10490 [Candidatus Thorarchaeota archaeon]